MPDNDRPILHLADPLRIDPETGSFATVVQDSLEEVRGCVHALMETERGVDRLLAADEDEDLLGVPDPTWTARGLDPVENKKLLEEQEPRAVVTIAVEGPDDFGAQSVVAWVNLADDGEQDQEDL